MPELQGQPGEVRFTIEVTRKDTGIVEKFDMVGQIVHQEPEENKPLEGEQQ